MKEAQIIENGIDSHLMFGLVETDRGILLEFQGLVELITLPNDLPSVRRVVNPWGYDIPIIDVEFLYKGGPTDMTSRACIVVFEYCESHKYHFGMIVADISEILDVADCTESQTSPLLLSAKRYLFVRPVVKN